ncbi:MAG: hypothetical protein HY738_04335 [Bacteroidia bacterium]|nr:hypothetical protein [Bacteroidia bacterium]
MAKNCSERPKNPYRKIIITNSKLKDADVAFMKTLINRGVAQTKIAKLFCISVTQVRRIARGENWGHVQPKQ